MAAGFVTVGADNKLPAAVQGELNATYATRSEARVEPAGFLWRDSPVAGTITKDQYGNVSTSYDVTLEKVVGGTTYYVAMTGSDANDGLTEATALRRVSTAWNKTDCGTIMVKAGTYVRADSGAGFVFDKGVNLIGYGGRTLLGNHDALVWALAAGQANTYQAARSVVGQVADMVNGGTGYRLTELSSIAEVEATRGSYYTDGTTIYVHTVDGRPADNNIHAYLTTGCIAMTADSRVYLENLTIHGGDSSVDMRCPVGGVGPDVFINNVRMGYSSIHNNYRMLGARLAVAVNCDSYHSYGDGFNYHVFQGVIPKAVEIGCRGFNNGGGSNSDNGSSIHDGGKIVRINGHYYGNRGGNIVDVSAGTQSWNVGTVARDSALTHDFYATTGAEMWLDGCSGTGSYISAEAVTGAVIRARNSKLERPLSVTAY